MSRRRVIPKRIDPLKGVIRPLDLYHPFIAIAEYNVEDGFFCSFGHSNHIVVISRGPLLPCALAIQRMQSEPQARNRLCVLGTKAGVGYTKKTRCLAIPEHAPCNDTTAIAD